MNVLRLASLAVGAALLCASAATAGRIELTNTNTSPDAPLPASLEWAFSDPFTLEVAITNETGGDAPYDVTLAFFNTSDRVSYLELVHAESSLEGENTDAWRVGYYGYDLLAPYHGEFDYSLRTEPGGDAADRIAPGETQRFTLSLRCVSYAGCDASDWLAHASDVSEVGRVEAWAALRFAYGPGGWAGMSAATRAPAPVPEPGPAALVALGLAALALRRRAAR